MQKIKVMAYRGDRAACWFYRLHAPLLYIARNNTELYDISVSGHVSKDQLENKYDVVLLQRQYKKEVLGPMLELKKKGAKLVYEIDDDLFNIPDWNPAHKVLAVKEVQDGIRAFLKHMDAMFVTTEELKNVYKNYCENVYVLPNSVDMEVMYNYPTNSKLPVVCWQGSMTHVKDVAVAKKGFEQLANDDSLVFKLWCGYDSKTHEPTYKIPGTQVLPLVPFEAFFQMFSQVDAKVGLAPLAAHPFNRSKSNLKWLEYTACNAVTVASNFGPYKDSIVDMETGVLVSDNREWYDKVKMLLNNEELFLKILSNAKKVVEEKYDISKNYVLWKNAIETIIERN